MTSEPGRVWSLLVAVAGVVAAGTWAALAPRTDLSVHLQHGWTAELALVPALVTAVLLVRRLPGHGVARAVTTTVLAHHTVLAASVAVEHGTGSALLDDVLARLAAAAFALTLPLIPVLILLFPTGRVSGRGWQALLRAQFSAIGLLLVLGVIHPESDPVGAVAVLAAGAGVVLALSAVAAVVRLLVTAGRLPPEERARGRLFVVLAAMIVASYGVLPLLPEGLRIEQAAGLGYALLVGGLPSAIGLSVLRHRLFGLEVILNRGLVGLLSGTVLLGAYLTAAYGVAWLGGPQVGSVGSVLVPALAVITVLAPVSRVSHRAVDRTLYGDRAEPQRALRKLGQALVAAGAPAQVPALVAQQLVTSLRVPWAAVELDDEGTATELASAGARGDGLVHRVDLVRGPDRLGSLLVEMRPGETALAAQDSALLSAVADQAAVALESVQLTEQLTRSRERLVAGREAERERLRRDLHDDLTPALAGIVLAVDASRRIRDRDPVGGDALLGRVEEQAKACGEVVRRLLADLQPAGLAELGLAASLEEVAARLSRPGEFEVQVDVRLPLPAVSGAVEVAAYRIAGEALSNAARHARARRCTVRVGGDAELCLEVHDDGLGFGAASQHPGSGLGLPSMRQRARDVGGAVEVVSAPRGGTTVRATLPALGQDR